MNWIGLLEPQHTIDNLTKGHFFVVKFTPDSVASEVFNLGVCFMEDGESKIHFRLIEQSLKGFACIYGNEAVEGLRLLLQSISHALTNLGHISSPSPQIKYTPLMPVTGLSVEYILRSLYRDYIHMDHYPEKDKKKKSPTLNTASLRRSVKRNLESLNLDSYFKEDKVYFKSDIELGANTTSGEIGLDLPIWRPQQEFSLLHDDYLFASVVSADYLDLSALSYNLDYLGCTSIQNACIFTDKKAKAGLFVYCPIPNERINREAMELIDNHIDNSLYILRRMKEKDNYNINIQVLYSEEDICHKVAEFVT